MLLDQHECECPRYVHYEAVCCQSQNGSCVSIDLTKFMIPRGNCSGVYTGNGGNITSQNYPSNYHNHQICNYNITAKQGHIVRFEILDAKFENDICKFDYLSFYENGALIGQFCRRGNVVYTKSNNLQVYFVSDETKNAKGFLGRWDSCDPTNDLAPDSCLRFNSYSTKNGTLTSPNYPLYYPKGLYINYTITIAEDRRIFFSIEELDFGRSESIFGCYQDYLLLNDNGTIFNRRFCSIKSNILTSKNTLRVSFITDQLGSGKGFKARWSSFQTVICDQVFNSDNGTITSPNYPSNYSNYLNCKYIINVSKGKKIRLELVDADIHSTSSRYCSTDYLRFKGRNDSSIGTYCKKGNVVYSRSNYLEINFLTDDAHTSRGFKANWVACFENTIASEDPCFQFHSFNSDNGTLSSPNYPLNYQNLLNITYKITVSEGKRIEFLINYVYLEYSPTCKYDYLLFEENGKLLGKFCYGRRSISTVGNTLTVKFITDEFQSSIGFNGTWRTYEAVLCGTSHNTDSGIIKSPNYPLNYGNYLECKYEIDVSPGKRIRFEIEDARLENSLCTNDYLSFQENKTFLGEFCTTGNIIYTKSNHLEVYFRSNGQLTARGFKGRWNTCHDNGTSNEDHCVHVDSYNYNSGIITSPNYPRNYQNNLNILYRIAVTSNRRIHFRFTMMDLEVSPNCTDDYILFKEESEVIGRYCSLINTDVLTSGNRLEIMFVTDRVITARGFVGRWNTFIGNFTGTCGGTFYEDEGEIASPNYPLDYDNNLNCGYIIHVSSGKRITFELLDSLFEGDSCTFDRLIFRENQTFLGRFCQTGNVVYSQGNVLLVNFTTDGSVKSRGFHARWHSCDANKIFYNGSCVSSIVYESNSGTITSPNYPSYYQNRLNITYHIIVERGKRIRFQLSSASFTSSSCLYDYLLLKENSKLFGRYCRFAIVYTDGNELTAIFVTDSFTSSTGFRATWRAVDTVITTPTTTTRTDINRCGNTYFYSPNGTIYSPNYPGNYENNLNCKYTILVPQGRRITFELVDASFEDDWCVYDHLTFQENSIVLGKYCVTGNVIFTRGNMLEIYLKTDGDLSSRGFFGKWSSCYSHEIFHNGSCKPYIEYNGYHGSIYSPNYPSAYQNHLDIKYRINAVEGMFIKFEILIGTTSDRSCTGDYLLFKEDSKFLGRYCNSDDIIYTNGTTLEVYFVTDREDNNDIFIGQWRSVNSVTPTTPRTVETTPDNLCGGVFNSDNGTITRHLAKATTNDSNCDYLIRVPAGKRITFGLLEFGSHDIWCNNKYLDFFENGVFLAHYCNSGNKVYTNGNELLVRFKSLSKTELANVTILGEWHSCYSNEVFHNGSCVKYITYNGLTGNVSSPNYPYNSQNNLNVIYKINVPYGKRIRFELLDGANRNRLFCETDYLLLKENSEVLGKYCMKGEVATTYGNSLEIVFITNQNFMGFPYFGRWSSFDTDTPTSTPASTTPTALCGQVFNKDSGVISSPNYPSNYTNNLICDYHIKVATGKRITFELFDGQFEDHYCNHDFLDFMENGSFVAHYCNKGNKVYTVGNELTVKFKTNPSVVARGFLGRWSSCSSSQVFHNGSCVSAILYKGDSGDISSPNYPFNSQNNLNITYIISVPKGKRISLEISDGLHSSRICHSDYMLFKENQSIIGKYCRQGSNITTKGNSLEIVFVTNAHIMGYPFYGKWTSIEKDSHTTPSTTSITSTSAAICGGTFNSDSGSLNVPIYPSRNDNILNCTYIINVAIGKNIKFELIDTHFEDAYCLRSYLWFKDRQENLGKYCKIGDKVTSKGNQLIIYIITDRSVPGKTISGKWTSFSATSSEISSDDSDDSNKVAITLGVVIPLVLITLLIVIFVIYLKKRNDEENINMEREKNNSKANASNSNGKDNSAFDVSNAYQDKTRSDLPKTSNPPNTYMNPAYEDQPRENKSRTKDNSMAFQLSGDLQAYENA